MNLVGLGGCTAERMLNKLLTRRVTEFLAKTSSTVYPDTALAMSCGTLPCGLEFSLEGESQARYLKDLSSMNV